jgi:hypothetical protein
MGNDQSQSSHGAIDKPHDYYQLLLAMKSRKPTASSL